MNNNSSTFFFSKSQMYHQNLCLTWWGLNPLSRRGFWGTRGESKRPSSLPFHHQCQFPIQGSEDALAPAPRCYALQGGFEWFIHGQAAHWITFCLIFSKWKGGKVYKNLLSCQLKIAEPMASSHFTRMNLLSFSSLTMKITCPEISGNGAQQET